MKYKCFFQRIGAYVVDALIVAIIAALFSRIDLINPYYDEYLDTYEEYLEAVKLSTEEVTEETTTEELTEETTTEELSEETTTEEVTSEEVKTNTVTDEELEELTYKVSYYGSYTELIALVVTLLYFVVFQYLNDGKTIGKALFKIKVECVKGKLSIWCLFLRTIFAKSVITTATLIIMLLACSETVYNTYAQYVSLVSTIVFLLNISFFLTRDDGKALHDIICKTRVVKIGDEQEK